MRGAETKQGEMFTLLSPERRGPKDHPLRVIKRLADEAVLGMSALVDGRYGAVGRALLRRRDAQRSVGVAQEFPAQRRAPPRSAAAGRSGKPDHQLPRREAVQCDARVDDRPGIEAGAQVQRAGGEAVVFAARAD